MIERLVFISTMFFLIMLGVNGFLIMGGELKTVNGQYLNIFDASSSGLSYNQITTDVGNVKYNPSQAEGISATAPGQATSVQTYSYQGSSPGFLGLNWIAQAVVGTQLLAFMLIGVYPFMAPIFGIYILLASALDFFCIAYWSMAGARAFFGRFL